MPQTVQLHGVLACMQPLYAVSEALCGFVCVILLFLLTHCAVCQLFLAMPTDCPIAPDGSKRSVPSGADERNSVSMYTSEDNAQTFKQVCHTCVDLHSLSGTETSSVLCMLLNQALRCIQVLYQAKTRWHVLLKMWNMCLGLRGFLKVGLRLEQHTAMFCTSQSGTAASGIASEPAKMQLAQTCGMQHGAY